MKELEQGIVLPAAFSSPSQACVVFSMQYLYFSDRILFSAAKSIVLYKCTESNKLSTLKVHAAFSGFVVYPIHFPIPTSIFSSNFSD